MEPTAKSGTFAPGLRRCAPPSGLRLAHRGGTPGPAYCSNAERLRSTTARELWLLKGEGAWALHDAKGYRFDMPAQPHSSEAPMPISVSLSHLPVLQG